MVFVDRAGDCVWLSTRPETLLCPAVMVIRVRYDLASVSRQFEIHDMATYGLLSPSTARAKPAVGASTFTRDTPTLLPAGEMRSTLALRGALCYQHCTECCIRAATYFELFMCRLRGVSGAVLDAAVRRGVVDV